MNSKEEKKYRLLDTEKTIPEWCAIFPFMWGRYFTDDGYGFELVEPSIVPEKIEVSEIRYHVNCGTHGVIAFFNSDYDHSKIPAIKSAILKALNEDTVVEYKQFIEYLQSELGDSQKTIKFLEECLEVNKDKVYTQLEVDAMMEEVFYAGRQTTDDYPNFDGHKYLTLADYKATLPLQQVPDKKFKIGDVVTKVNGTTKMTVEGYGYRNQNMYLAYPHDKAVQVVYFRPNGQVRRKTICEDKLMLYTEPQPTSTISGEQGEQIRLSELLSIKNWVEYNQRNPPTWGTYRIRRKGNADSEGFYRLSGDNGIHLSEQLGQDFEWLERLPPQPFIEKVTTDTISSNNDDVARLSLKDFSEWYERWYPNNPMKEAFLNGLKNLVKQKLKNI